MREHSAFSEQPVPHDLRLPGHPSHLLDSRVLIQPFTGFDCLAVLFDRLNARINAGNGPVIPGGFLDVAVRHERYEVIEADCLDVLKSLSDRAKLTFMGRCRFQGIEMTKHQSD